MKKILLGLCLLLAGCAATTKKSSAFPGTRDKIKSFAVFEPKIYLERLVAGGRVLDADNLNLVREHYLNAMRETVPGVRVDEQRMELRDTTYARMVDQFFWDMNRQKSLDEFTIAPDLQDVLKKAPDDFVVLGSITGFSRSGGSYAWGIAKGVMIGILTLGMFYTVPIGSSTNVNLAVIDKANMKVIYFGWHGIEDSPKDYDVIRGIEEKIFKDYLAKM